MRGETRILPVSDGEISLKKNGRQIVTSYKKGDVTYKGIGTVASHVSNDEDLANVINFIVKNVSSDATRKIKLRAFYPNIDQVVDNIYAGDSKWLNNPLNRGLVKTLHKPFRKAAKRNKDNGGELDHNVTGIEYILGIIDPS